MAAKGNAMRRRRILNSDIDGLDRLSRAELRAIWAEDLGGPPPASIGRGILALGIAYARQERSHGGISERLARELDRTLGRLLQSDPNDTASPRPRPALRSGTILVREWQGTTHHVTIVDEGFVWNGQTHRSLSRIARTITGTKWNGPRFFGMRDTSPNTKASPDGA